MHEPLRRHPHLLALAACVLSTVAATWPLAARLGTAVGRAGGGSWQTLWSLWWWRDSLARGSSPFACDALRWPAVAAGWWPGLDLPAAMVAWPLWGLTPGLPEVAIYNVVLLASHALTGWAVYLLTRELWGGYLGALLAGVAYVFVGIGVAAVVGGPAAAALHWPPLYFVGLVRTLRHQGAGGPLLAALALAAGTVAAPAQLLACGAGTVVLVAWWLRAERSSVLDAGFARRALIVAATFAAAATWTWWGADRSPAGADPLAAGVDLAAALVPGWAPGAAGASGGARLGWVGLAVAALAAVRAKASRGWIWVAALGLALALGPRLVLAGRDLGGGWLPYALLARALPVERAGAAAASFWWLVPFGVAVAGGAALAGLARSGRRGAAIAVALAALVAVEAWPRASTVPPWPAPRFLRDLARDGERWTVLDATSPPRRLWHQVLHRHPQAGADTACGDAGVEGHVPAPAVHALLGSGQPAPRADAVRALQRLNVRFVIVDQRSRAAAALALPRAWEGDGLVVFEVPPRAG